MLMFLLLGCDEPTLGQQEPPSLNVELQETEIYGDTPVSIQITSNQKMEMTEGDYEYQFIPSDILKPIANGKPNEQQFTCQASGEFSVLFTAFGTGSFVKGTCTLIDNIVVPKSYDLILDVDTPSFEVQINNEKGETVSIPIEKYSIDVEDNTVVESSVVNEKVTLTPKSVGKTTISYSLGSLSAKTKVVVSRKLESAELKIDDGKSYTRTLQKGTYAIEIIAQDSYQYGTTLEWIGADCPTQTEKTNHKVQCSVYNTATLKINNPSILGMGEPVYGHLNIYEMPL